MSPTFRRLRLAFAVLAFTTFSGCAVVSVVGSAAGAAISVGGAVISTGVEVTGKVIGKTIDMVTPGDADKVEKAGKK